MSRRFVTPVLWLGLLAVGAANAQTIGEHMDAGERFHETQAAIQEHIREKLRPSRCSYAKFYAGRALEARILGYDQRTLYGEVLTLGPDQTHLLSVVIAAYDVKLDRNAEPGPAIESFKDRVYDFCMTKDDFHR